ncbi:MAG: hypothetical protein IJ724_03580 [Muribaculaceae bacterium]|nr:hypothetical protein [Muribaculaceae bacterium]
MEDYHSIDYIQEIKNIYYALDDAANNTGEYWNDSKKEECYSMYVDKILHYIWQVKDCMEIAKDNIEKQLREARSTREQYLYNNN